MFVKPFKVKSNNQLKGSERKKLCEEVLKSFPTLTPEEIKNLLSKKDSVSAVKIVTHNGHVGKIYCASKVPVFFELNSYDTLFPTIFTLWQYPNLLPVFLTRDPVVTKLASGANLMLPGVVTDEPITFHSYGKFKKGTPVSISTDSNQASVAVGVTSLSSEDMYMSGGHGKCVDIFHVIGDSICEMEKLPGKPDLGLPINVRKESELVEENSADVVEEIVTSVSEIIVNEGDIKEINECISDNDMVPLQPSSTETVISSEPDNLDPTAEMDKLLEYCFLKACKVGKKKIDLPVITSTFFKNHVISACPPNCTIDIKKSSYKKLSVFLATMKEKGLINTSTVKGVESLLSIKYDHPLLKELIVMEDELPVKKELSNAPSISECYRVTANVVPILSKFGYEKGDILKRAEIRRCFTEYVKSENLQDGKIIKINPQLADVLRTKENQECLTMEDGINKFIGKMTHTHEITIDGKTILHSGKLEPIDITVTTRASNKKVTLINNLETYGIKLEDFSKECQGIGASATVVDVPGKKTPSVLVQGNQVLYVNKLLTEKYQISKNHIKGLEFAPKKKKK